jgi:uncharacterized membrane protein
MGLGTFGAFDSQSHDVSADGTVVVGVVTNFPDQTHGVFRWTKNDSVVYRETVRSKVAVSDDGSTVVGSRYLPLTTLDEAFRWIPSEGLFEGLADFSGGAFLSRAHDVSEDGSVIVGHGEADSGTTAFRWTKQGGMSEIGPGTAHGVSSDGNRIVGESVGAFRWTSSTGMIALPSSPGSIGSSATAVSANGIVAAGYHLFPQGTLATVKASFWTNGAAVTFDSWGWSMASDVSANGSVVVGRGIHSGSSTAFYWSAATGMVSVKDMLLLHGATNLDGWELTSTTGVSHDGRTIVGSGIHEGRLQAWVATIPEPSTIVLVMLAAPVALVVALGRRTRAACRPVLAIAARAVTELSKIVSCS